MNAREMFPARMRSTYLLIIDRDIFDAAMDEIDRLNEEIESLENSISDCEDR